ncbi:MAG: CHAT domain-containing tetratricopeptide repeat protein [Cyclobacteriaceae bacterium]
MKRFFSSLLILCIGYLVSAQDQVNFELEVGRIDSLIKNQNFGRADSALNELKASLENTSLLEEDTVLLYFTSNLAVVSYQLGNCEKTIKYSKEDKAMKAAVYGEGSPITLAAARNLGIYYLNCDSTAKAGEVLQQTIALHQEHIGQPDEIYVRTLDDLAFTLGKLDKTEEANGVYEELLKLLGDTKSNFYYHVVENYSAFLMSSEKYEEAAPYYEDLKTYNEGKAEFPILLRDYYNLFVNLKDYVGALEASNLLISKCADNQICESESINTEAFVLNSARLSMLLSRYADAKSLYLEAEKVFGENPSIYISILLEQAELYETLGDRNAELSKLNQSVDFHRENGLTDSSSYTRSVTNLGTLYTETGKFGQADELFSGYIKILESKGEEADPSQLAIAYQSLGNQRYFLQNLKDADLYLIKARDLLLRKNLNLTNDYASVLNSLGALYEGLANYQAAERNYREALSIANSGTSGLRISLASNLANILLTTDPKNDSIRTLLNSAIDWQLELTGKSHPTYANMIGNRGAFYMKRNNFDEAEQDLNQAIEIFQYTVREDHSQYLSALSNLGLLYEQMDRNDQALATMLKAKGLYEKYYSRTNPGFILTLNNIANLYTKLEKYEEAEPLFMELAAIQVKEINESFSYLSESEKKRFVEEKQKLLDNFKGYIVARTVNDEGSIDAEVLTRWYDLELSTKGMLLNATKKTRDKIFNSGDTELIALFSDWTAARKQVADIQSLKNDHKASQSLVDSLASKINDLEKEISRKSTGFSGAFANNAPTYSEISQRLMPNEASVEIIRTQIDGDALYVALVGIASSSSPQIFVIGKGEELEQRAFNGYRNKITFKIDDVAAFESYWRKIHDFISSQGVEKVYYAPDGVYHKISLVTLFNPDEKKYLLDELEIVQLTSTKDLLDIKNEVQKPAVELEEVLLVGRPSYALGATTTESSSSVNRGIGMDGIADLPGTELEVKGIGAVLEKGGISCNVKLGDDANESAVKEALNSQLVHIATHGFFNDKSADDAEYFDPMINAGLLLAGVSDVNDGTGEDGILTAYEIMNLELSNVDMIVLSACETALGEISSGQGIYGLQRAFFVGGAKTLIMSLWKVDDEATKELMTVFYKEYLKNGDKRAAFTAAQRKIKKKYKSPIYWGAFVMLAG